MNLCVLPATHARALKATAALLILLGGSASASARPRATPPVFTAAHGSDGVAHFGPAVGRAVAAALLAAGVETGAGGELAIVGRIEELRDDRVRLVATVHGHTLAAEGPIEAIDIVADELASRLAPMLGGRGKDGGEPAAKESREAATLARKEASLGHLQHTVAPAAHLATESVAPSTTPAAPSTTPPPASTAPAPAAKEATPSTSKDPVAAPAPTTPPATAATPAPASASSTLPAAAPTTAPVPPATTPGETRPPTVAVRSAGRADEDEETPPRPPPYPYGYVRGRVVAHAIADIPSAFAGTGASATQAFYYFLRRRLNLQVIPTGYGLAPPSIAADEGWRAGARAIVMARLHGIEYRQQPSSGAQSVVLRLEVMVVRDGRLVLRRLIQSAPTDPGPVGLRRTRSLDDPVFQAVMQSLESVVSELAISLADIR